MTIVTVTNQTTGKSLSWDFAARADAAAFILELCMAYDSSTFTINVKQRGTA